MNAANSLGVGSVHSLWAFKKKSVQGPVPFDGLNEASLSKVELESSLADLTKCLLLRLPFQ